MPIYEYLCGACGHVLDALQKVSEDPLTYCPECGKQELKRQLSAPAFRLKGGGWYETDFKDKNKRNLVDGGNSSDKPKASDNTGEKSDQKSAGSGDGAGKSKGADAAAGSQVTKSGD